MPNPTWLTIAKRLRTKAGMPSVRDIAARTHPKISHTAVAGFFAEDHHPKWATLNGILQALDATPEDIGEALAAYGDERAPTSGPPARSDTQQLSDAINNLAAAIREAAQKM